MKSILICALLILTVSRAGFTQNEFSLDEALQAGLENNYDIRISTIETEKAENRVSRGYAGQLPTLSVNGALEGSYSDQELVPGSFFRNLANPGSGSDPGDAQTIEFDGVSSAQLNAGIGAGLVIYDGKKGRLRYKITETGENLADLQLRSTMEQTLLSITRHYLQTASLQKAMKLKRVSLQQSRDRYEVMETRREFGQAGRQELLQALADLKSDSTQYRNLILDYNNAYRTLLKSIGLKEKKEKPLQEEFSVASDLRHEELIRKMLSNSTPLDLMRQKIRNSELKSRITKAGYLPQVTANAQYGYSNLTASNGQFESQKQLGFTGGLSFKIPIYSGGQTRIKTENALASVRQEQLRYEDAEQELRTQFENAWQEYLHLQSKIDTEQENIGIYKRNFERARDSFERGLITGLELRAAQLSLEEAHLRLSDTDIQLKLTETMLLYLTGDLIEIQ